MRERESYFDPPNPDAKGRMRVRRFNGTARPEVNIKTRAELRLKEFSPIRYVVKGYLVEGCTILAGRPKLGKSWLMLDIGLTVARGGCCLGDIQCELGDVLYLALEDNERRLQDRITRLIGYGREWPDHFHYATEWPRSADGGLEEITNWISSVSHPRLIIVDVPARFRSPRRNDQQPYEADYAAIQGLQAIASKTGVAIVIVHHLRKGIFEGDPFERVSGTLGLSGAADSVLILDRDAQGTTLYGRGRDLEEIETALQFSKETCKWKTLGAAAEVRVSDERSVILETLRQSKDPLSPRDVADLTGKSNDAIRQMLIRMATNGEVVRAGRGLYRHSDSRDSPPSDGVTKVSPDLAASLQPPVTGVTKSQGTKKINKDKDLGGPSIVTPDCDTAARSHNWEGQSDKVTVVTGPCNSRSQGTLERAERRSGQAKRKVRR
jgi:hypothetical protein